MKSICGFLEVELATPMSPQITTLMEFRIHIPANSMDLWSRSDGPKILPPAYTRQPGRPKSNKRIKDTSEKVINGIAVARRCQRSLNCSNCGQEGHNILTCQRHLPSKKKPTTTKKTTDSENGPQKQKEKRKPLTVDELRKKAEERLEYQRKKMATLRAERRDANRPKRGRPPSKPSTASTASRPPAAPPVQASSASAPRESRATRNGEATSTKSSKRVRKS